MWEHQQEVERCAEGGDDVSRQVQCGFPSRYWWVPYFDLFFPLRFYLLCLLCPGVEMKATLLAVTFLIDYLHFEADPGDSEDEED